MTASAQDVLTYVQTLENTGFSHDQAIAIASGLEQAMDRHIDTRVTREHLDVKMAAINARFDAIEKSLEKLEDVPSVIRLHTWMLALITVTLVVPKLQEWFPV
ncbi:MAG: hypothetical protein V2I82_10400 [Halieaceae bacterium]|jgi:hypothetical protein|nr:hypothetical protein [Halieaceae bacterium]